MKKLPALTSLRFFAAFAVVLHHSAGFLAGSTIAKTLALRQGVSFFFVLSGFILTYTYISAGKKVDWWRFYLHRFARIFPTHVAGTILFIFLAGMWIPAIFSGDEYRHALYLNLAMAQSAIPLEKYYFSYNLVSWSISTEAFFYLAFPLMFTGKGKAPWIGFAASLLAFAVMCWLSLYMGAPQDSHTELSVNGLMYVNPLARMVEFALGCVTCHLFKSRAPTKSRARSVSTAIECVAVIAVFVGLYAGTHARPFVSYYFGATIASVFGWAGAAPIFAFLIYVFARQSGRVSEALSARPFVFLGEISFALYVTHFAILTKLEQYPEHFQGNVETFWIYLAMCLMVAWATHMLIENPFRTLIVEKRLPTGATVGPMLRTGVVASAAVILAMLLTLKPV
ncbi:acyltransferase family protein [Caballeronia cordobensis]|uniref:acyltransferase family protein n=1 Tax=Caballeronia cordobensis TaxID=1353886 RepID=UPI00045EE373|nr:acyltransferase 3 [Burkholderia sp. RPE67]